MQLNGVHVRFQFSFGAWTELAAMLEQIEFMQLQALNKRAYNVNISRAQIKLKMPKKLYALIRGSKLYVYDQNSQWQ